MLSRFLDRILAGMAVLAGLLLLFITFSISYSIFLRAAGLRSPLWTVQCNEYSLLWMTFLGSAWVLSRRKHVAVDVITGQLRSRAKRVSEIVHSLVGIGLCGVLCWNSALMTLNLFQRGVMDVQAVDVPKYLILVVIPVGFLALTLQFGRNLATSLRRNEADMHGVMLQKSDSESPSRVSGAAAEGRNG